MKKSKLFLFTLVAFLVVGFAVNVNADEPTIVTTFEELKAIEDVGGSIKLGNDITMINDIYFRQDLTLDLNGHTINTNTGYTLIIISNVIFKDTGYNGKITNGDLVSEYIPGTDYQSIQVGRTSGDGYLNIESGNYEAKYLIHAVNGKLTINGGNFKATSEFIIGNSSNGTFETEINGGNFLYEGTYQAINSIGSKVVFNDGVITSSIGSGIVGFKDADITVNGGSITGYNFAISGNGSAAGDNEGTNAKFTITGGTLKATHGTAIYAPQVNGMTTITGGTIEGIETAIEIRAGKLIITDGIFKASTDHNGVNPNGNGTTTYGVALAIAQHSTKQPIDVTITGGVFTAYIGFKESNPENNASEDIAKVSASIEGGIFRGTSGEAVYSEDLTGFITGGSFSNDVSKYVAEGHESDVKITLANAVATTAKTSYVYTGKVLKPTVIVKIGKTTLVADKDYELEYSNNKNVGTATITVIGKGKYEGTIKTSFKITKAANTLTVKNVTKTVKYAKVKKAKQVVKPITVTKQQGKLSYTKLSGSKYLAINKTTGKVTVKKATKKGTYKIKVKVSANGNTNYKSGYKTVTITVKVK